MNNNYNDLTSLALEEWEPLRNPIEGTQVFRIGKVYAKFCEERTHGFYIFFTHRDTNGERLFVKYSPNFSIKEALEQRIEEAKNYIKFHDVEIHFMDDLCYLFGEYYLAPMWNYESREFKKINEKV